MTHDVSKHSPNANSQKPVSALRVYRDIHNLTLAALGEKFDPPVDRATVYRWEVNGVSAERAVWIETQIGVSREALRPDLFRKAGAA